jgi:hypothetical protein
MIDCIPQGILPYQTWRRTAVVEVVVWFWKLTPPGPFHPVTAPKNMLQRRCFFYKRRSYRVGSTEAEFSIPMDGDECGVFKVATTSKLVEILMMYIQSIIDR